jgi:hypothetical protein
MQPQRPAMVVLHHPEHKRMKITSALPLLLLIAATQASAASKPEVRWLKVLLQGQQIGSVEHSRHVVGDTVINTERFDASLARAGTALSIRTEESHRESLAGTPLGFSTLTEMGGMAQRAEGVIGTDGKVSVSFSQGKDVRVQNLVYPKGALMSEGMRLLEDSKKLKPGESLKFRAFMPSQLEAVPATVTFVGEESIRIDSRDYSARHMQQTLALSTGPITLQSWTDANGEPLRSELPMFGMKLEMVISDKKAAGHRDAPTDLFAATVISAPRALSITERAGDLTYALELSDATIATNIPRDEQVLTSSGTQWQLLVDMPPSTSPAAKSLLDAKALEASAWVQSDAPEIIAFAKKSTRNIKGARAQMLGLQSAVSRHISDKNLRVGYASALEALRMREGDCTEHALLLAAAGRALGIPTRVAVGLAYTDAFAGHAQSFIPHAWAQAWIDGHWSSFDAALGGFDSGHIALAVGSGDPTTFYGSIQLLGNLKIKEIRSSAL